MYLAYAESLSDSDVISDRLVDRQWVGDSRLGIRASRPHSLTIRNYRLRLRWAPTVPRCQPRDWQKVVITDESRYCWWKTVCLPPKRELNGGFSPKRMATYPTWPHEITDIYAGFACIGATGGRTRYLSLTSVIIHVLYMLTMKLNVWFFLPTDIIGCCMVVVFRVYYVDILIFSVKAARCSSVVERPLKVRWVIRSIPIVLFLVPASVLQLV